jgi:hypothetical protein
MEFLEFKINHSSLTDIITILRKVFIQQFYALNAGFFLLIITLTFGFMSGIEHKALAQFFTASPHLTLIPITIWLIYLIKIINFNRSRLILDENKFLREFALVGKVSRHQALFAVVTSQFAPAIAYGIFLLLTAIKSQQWIIALLIILAQVALIMSGTFATEKAMHDQSAEIHVWRIKTWFDRRFTKPLFIIYVTWIMRREPMLVIATKIFCGALLFAVTQLYKTDVYDWRLLAMGSLLAVAANYMMVTQLQQFENVHFQFLRNLPTSTIKRLATIVVVISILMLPEFVIIIKNFPINLTLWNGLSEFAFIIAGTLYFYSLNYLSIPADNFTRWTLGSVIGSILPILFNVPLLILTCAALAIAWLIIHFRYFNFEMQTTKD